MNIKSCMIAALGAACYLTAAAETRRFDIRDSIEMTRFSEPSGRDREGVPLTSPDGKYFVVVTSRGVIANNEIESRLWLFENQAIKSYIRMSGQSVPPAPSRLATAKATPIRPATDAYEAMIWGLRWSSDSRSIYFLEQGSTGQRQLWKADIGSRRSRKLSPERCDVERFSVGRNVIVFSAAQGSQSFEENHSISGQRDERQSQSMLGQPIYNILFPANSGSLVPHMHRLWVVRGGRTHILPGDSPPEPDLEHYWDVLSISPDGRYVVQLRPVASIPRIWEAYTTVPGREDWKLDHNDPKITSPSYLWRARQYVRVDLVSGKVHPLIGAPYGDVLAHLEATQAVWSPNGDSVLLTNTFLPLEDDEAREPARSTEMCAVAEVQVRSGHKQCIVFTRDSSTVTVDHPNPLELDNAGFGTTANEVMLHFSWPQDQRGQTEWYRKVNETWSLTRTVTDPPKSVAGYARSIHASSEIWVRIKQGLDEPPTLWATDYRTGQTRELWNPNPQFTSLEMGNTSIIHWQDNTGHQWTGGLVKPVGFIPGKKYPLVIQTHGFLDFEFMTDGQYPTGMAASALASDGFVVLQMQTDYSHIGETTEAYDNVRGYASAIAQLVSEGLVDPHRVGIIGFSRTSWYVETALIEHSEMFAAASIIDGTDQSYMQEMLFQLDRVSEGQQMYAAKPFGSGLQKWLQFAPSFRLDKVASPVMLTAIGKPSILQEWEVYSSLYKQGKPVEMMFVPDDQHILQKPLSRLASQQNCVDWFRFWLQGYERPDPDDPQQYLRWNKMRDAAKAH